MNKQKLDMYDIENIAWTLHNFYFNTCSDCCPDEYMYDCARAILIINREGCGECMLAEDFLDAAKHGSLLPYDGEGYFCDKDGNNLGDVWSTKTVPVDTKFVVWFNK